MIRKWAKVQKIFHNALTSRLRHFRESRKQPLVQRYTDLCSWNSTKQNSVCTYMVEKKAIVACFHGVVEISVGEDDHGAFSTEFKAHALEISLTRRLHYYVTNLRAKMSLFSLKQKSIENIKIRWSLCSNTQRREANQITKDESLCSKLTKACARTHSDESLCSNTQRREANQIIQAMAKCHQHERIKTNPSRPSECHFINVHMFAYRCSSGRSISWHHVYYSRWKTSLWSKNTQRSLFKAKAQEVIWETWTGHRKI